MTATIINLPRPVCFNCLHSYSGAAGVYCRMFDQTIHDETVARTCPEYKDSFMTPKQGSLTAAKRAHPSSQAVPEVDRLRKDLVELREAMVALRNEGCWKPTRDQAMEYVKSLHTTLWGIQLIVSKPDDLGRAADWIINLYESMERHANGS